MTEEELDLLASSYLDGEATPEEVAMIERDPTLLARVDLLRIAQAAVRTPTPRPSPQLKEEQLAAALAAFDSSDRRTTLMAVDMPHSQSADEQSADEPSDGLPGSSGTAQAINGEQNEGPVDDTVIDLRARRTIREERESATAGRMRWLSAVAGVLVFLGGAVFLAGQLEGGDDGEFATADAADDTAVDTATEGGDAMLAESSESAPAAAADGATEAGSDDAADEAIESEALVPDAEEDFALDEAEEDADDEATDDADTGETADAEAAATGPTIRLDLAEEGFFGDEPVASYSSIPTSEELLAELDLPWRDPESATCAGQAILPAGAQVIGYLPIEIPGEDGSDEATTRIVEALYLTVASETQVILVDLDTCETL